MGSIKRSYDKIILDHITSLDQMVFLAGPRQVGKTHISQRIMKKFPHHLYLNWDDVDDKAQIIQGQKHVAQLLKLKRTIPRDGKNKKNKVIVFDELHKFSEWQTWLKGFYDVYRHETHIIVTGSSKLDVYRKGGDSMAGRYFLYHVHPFTIAELLGRITLRKKAVKPKEISNHRFNKLLKYGGFPDPFIKGTAHFYKQWSNLRNTVIFQQEIRDLTTIQEVGLLELLALFIGEQVGKNTSYSSLAKKIGISESTVKRWLKTLQSIYYCFAIQPWSKNITRSLIKEPKYYLWDWALINDEGARKENFVASHLLKAIHYWNDTGMGRHELYYLRDKSKREVDFLVTKERKPWFLVEVKNSSNAGITPALHYFQKQTKADHAFQIVFDQPFIKEDCFSFREPVIMPASTFLSQLV